ncbi:hypothetical protein LYSHEL_26580 [Lysobacter helvus]|uniref:STAS/SEC14 domain-containing protein n=2 Tax=Lysobacteraceae TaxID=32033 RepID=A0ABN6FVC0_9GAMM|nr:MULTISPECIES: hypothetical protein [Lysobacter]BCT93633.1 hypothetical protein LYSCAS_26570 [Lysobacter caseinilyticus]BCT96787.1 hypothetical protein LYSHEL_26580 [Lysobacter helvus]
MQHDVTALGPDIVVVRYFGRLTIKERCQTLVRAGRAFHPDASPKKLLVDYSYATPAVENADAGIDFMSRVIAAPDVDDGLLAITGTLSADFLNPVLGACATKGLTCRVFSDYDLALDWLRRAP